MGFLEDGTFDDLQVPLLKLFCDDRASEGKTVERDLREKVMFWLVLHAAHNNEWEDVVECKVAAGLDLVLEELHIYLSLELVFVLVVADEDGRRE